MDRKWISFTLTAALTLSLLTFPAAGATVGDTDEAVAVLSGLGLISGYPDGLYHLEDSLTRAQFCKLAILAEGHGDQAAGSAHRSLFSDVPGSDWAAAYIDLAAGVYGGGYWSLLAGGPPEKGAEGGTFGGADRPGGRGA